mgnify:CR=1 FL=1
MKMLTDKEFIAITVLIICAIVRFCKRIHNRRDTEERRRKRMIKKYQNDKTKLNIPHRAVYTSPKNLLVGAPGELISDLDIFFNREKRQTQIYSTGDLGTLIAEDELVQVAC